MPLRLMVSVVLCGLLLAVPAGVAFGAEPLPASFPIYTGDEFNELFIEAPLPGLDSIGPAPEITGDSVIDDRIRDIAAGRGYLRRPLPSEALTSAGGYLLQADAVAAWLSLEAAAAQRGFDLVLASGFRDHATQRVILLEKLTSFTPEAIDARLRYVAPPGYSKHHTGYAIDITQAGYGINTFRSSPAYAWLAADNYANAKKHGWIPSYPPDASAQGPVPEPWEFTYVGIHTLVCGPHPLEPGDVFCDDDGSIFAGDIRWMAESDITRGCNPPRNDRFCPGLAVTRGQVAAFLARMLDLPPSGESFVDDDGSVFERDIEALAGAGITRGCNPPANDRFCPERTVTRAEMAAFLVRAFALPAGPGGTFVDDDGSIFEADIEALAAAGITRGCNPPENSRFCPEAPVTREQLAAFLHRAAERAEAGPGGAGISSGS